MDAAGGPDAFLEDHAVIVCSDHSQSQVEQEIDLFRAFDGFDVLPAARARSEEQRDRPLPGLARGAGLRARPRAPRRADPAHRAHAAGARGRRPRDAADRPSGRRGARARPARRRRRAAAGAARRPRRTRAASAGASRATSALLGLRGPRRARRLARSTPTRSGACGRRCAAAPPARCWPRRGRATSSSTGAARTTSAAARTARCTPTTRSARCCGAAPGPPADSREQWTLRDIVPMVCEHFGLVAA